MPQEPARFRPKAYPPPEFPPRRPALFARMPPAVFPVILGALGLVLALRKGLATLGLDPAPLDILTGAAAAFWAFAAMAYATKLIRRPGVLWQDLKVLPGRAGLAAGTAGALALSALLAPIAPEAARITLFAGLVLHGAIAFATLRALANLPPEGRDVNPSWHLTFTGFIIGAPAAASLDLPLLAQALFWTTLPIALAIWAVSLRQIITHVPPAPLRPLLAIHLAPAALFTTTAGLIGQAAFAQAWGWVALALGVALLASLRWIAASGFSALWGSFTFPLAALATALLSQPSLIYPGFAVLVLALFTIPVLLWRVLRLWPTGQLAARTNAAEA